MPLSSIDNLISSFDKHKPNLECAYRETLILNDEMKDILTNKLKEYGFKNIIIQESTALCYAHIGHDAFIISYMED